MAGKLTIHSSGDGSLLSGHSWVEYQPDGGEARTYGTWGNNPTGRGNGLFVDLEKGRAGDASRSVRLDDEQEKKLYAKIKSYQDKGQDGWGYLSPCSAFAADAWQTATGEKLSHRSMGISNPSKLKESIKGAGQAKAQSPPRLTRPASSRRLIRQAVEPCSRESSGGGGSW
jgi:hypothetical protein